MTGVIFNTNGKGLWASEKRSVRIVDIELCEAYEWDENDITGELRVYFDEDMWRTERDGLIYTDPQFLRELRAFFKSQGLPGKDVFYSEQGMQGFNYVSFDAGTKFYKAWMKKFNIPKESIVLKPRGF